MRPFPRLVPFIAFLALMPRGAAQITYQKYAASSIFTTYYSPKVVACDDGGFALLNTWNYFGTGFGDHNFMRFGPNGDTLWTRNFADHCNLNSLWLNADGGYFFQGLNDHGTSLFSIERRDANGLTIWNSDHQLFGFGGQDFSPRTGFETSAGDFHVGGDLGNADSLYIGLARFTSAGLPIGASTYSSDGGDDMAFMFPTPDGGYLIGGTHRPDYTSFTREAMAIKLDANGDTLWTRLFHFANADGSLMQSATNTHDGAYLLQGTLHDTQFGGLNRTFLIKADAMGDTLWSRVIDREFIGKQLVELTDHRIALVLQGATLVMFDSTGTFQNFRNYPGSGGFNSAALLNDGGLMCAGISYVHHDPGFDQAMFLMKTDGNASSGCGEDVFTSAFPWPTALSIGHIPTVRRDKSIITPVQWTTDPLWPKELVDVCINTGVAEPDAVEGLAVYPLPASTSCRIGFTKPTTGQLTFYDVRGALAHSLQVRSQKTVNVDVSEWAPGLYLLRMREKDGQERAGRLIVE